MAFAALGHRSNPAAFMGVFDTFSNSFEAYGSINTSAGTRENVCNNAAEIIIVDEDHFEQLPPPPPAAAAPPYSSTETSWYSSSSEDYSIEGFYPLDSHQAVNSSVNLIPDIHHSLYAHSAFCTYIGPDLNAAVDFSKPGQILQKRCFRFLSKIDEERKLASQKSKLAAASGAAAVVAGQQEPKSGFQNKSAVQHMIAERNRRVKLKQHFSNLYSFLPRNSKKDKHSILANTTRCLSELKLRIAELEQRNQALEESIPAQFSNQEQLCTGFESHDRPFNSAGKLLYSTDEVVLEQSKDNMPCQVNMRITVQTNNIVSCPTSVLIKALERLKQQEHLEIRAIQSRTETCWFQANILLLPKGSKWDSRKWQNLGDMIRQCLHA